MNRRAIPLLSTMLALVLAACGEVKPPPPDVSGGEAPGIELFALSASIVATGQEVSASWSVTSVEDVTCSIDWGDGTLEAVDCASESVGARTHAYTSEGPRTVELTATNANGSSTAKVFPTVHDDDPTKFDIVVVFANDMMSSTQVDAFQAAADRWSEVIVGDLVGVQADDLPPGYSCAGEPAFSGTIDDLVVSAAGVVIDGPGKVLGRAGPCLIRGTGSNGDLFPLPLYGYMEFDVADLDNLESKGSLQSTILHEMGHVLGLGTLWDANDLLAFEPEGACSEPSSFTTKPTYTGTEGNAQYVTLGGTEAAPVEDEHGPGTKCGHWDEEHFGNELMTGFLDLDSEEPLSVLTVGALEDLGYSVDLAKADPYPFPPPAARLAGEPQPYGYDEILLLPQYMIGR